MKLVDQTLVPPPYLHLRGPQPSPPPPYDAPADVLARYDEQCSAVRKRLEAGDLAVLDDLAFFPANPGLPQHAEAPPGWSGAYGLVVAATAEPGRGRTVLAKVLELAAPRGKVRPHAWCTFDRETGALHAWSRGVDARWLGDTGRVLIVEWTAKDEPNGYWLVQSGAEEQRTRLEQPEGDARCAQDLSPTECPGRWIVWLADGHGESSFHLVEVGDAGASRVYCDEWNPWQARSGGGTAPALSPDGRWLGYLSTDDEGAPVVVVCDLDAGLASAHRFPPSLEPFAYDEGLRLHVHAGGALRASTPDHPGLGELSLTSDLGAPRPWRR